MFYKIFGTLLVLANGVIFYYIGLNKIEVDFIDRIRFYNAFSMFYFILLMLQYKDKKSVLKKYKHFFYKVFHVDRNRLLFSELALTITNKYILAYIVSSLINFAVLLDTYIVLISFFSTIFFITIALILLRSTFSTYQYTRKSQIIYFSVLFLYQASLYPDTLILSKLNPMGALFYFSEFYSTTNDLFLYGLVSITSIVLLIYFKQIRFKIWVENE